MKTLLLALLLALAACATDDSGEPSHDASTSGDARDESDVGADVADAGQDLDECGFNELPEAFCVDIDDAECFDGHCAVGGNRCLVRSECLRWCSYDEVPLTRDDVCDLRAASSE